jgi:hypothetical protein
MKAGMTRLARSVTGVAPTRIHVRVAKDNGSHAPG